MDNSSLFSHSRKMYIVMALLLPFHEGFPGECCKDIKQERVFFLISIFNIPHGDTTYKTIFVTSFLQIYFFPVYYLFLACYNIHI
jgi:hypothetical protein